MGIYDNTPMSGAGQDRNQGEGKGLLVEDQWPRQDQYPRLLTTIIWSSYSAITSFSFSLVLVLFFIIVFSSKTKAKVKRSISGPSLRFKVESQTKAKTRFLLALERMGLFSSEDVLTGKVAGTLPSLTFFVYDCLDFVCCLVWTRPVLSCIWSILLSVVPFVLSYLAFSRFVSCLCLALSDLVLHMSLDLFWSIVVFVLRLSYLVLHIGLGGGVILYYLASRYLVLLLSCAFCFGLSSSLFAPSGCLRV